MNFLTVIIIVIIVICLIYFLITLNKLIKLNNETKEAFSTMDVYLKKRWDLIPNIVETIKGYTKHEENVLKEIVDIRTSEYESLTNNEKIKSNEKMRPSINKLMALKEAYPDLKANEHFLELQASLKEIEDEIAQSRKYYNATVRDYNNIVEMIPSNFIAKITGYKIKNMFEAEAAERENTKVNLK